MYPLVAFYPRIKRLAAANKELQQLAENNGATCLEWRHRAEQLEMDLDRERAKATHFYLPDGTFTILPAEEVTLRRVESAQLIEHLQNEVARLARMLAEPEFLDMQVSQGAMSLTVKHWAARCMAVSLADSFKGATNFMSMEVGPFETEEGKLLLVIQKLGAETPTRQLDRLRTELDRANRTIEALQARIALSATDEPSGEWGAVASDGEPEAA